ncbi:MAG TPA: ABC transporter permease [Vicinamibacterales bacterium]
MRILKRFRARLTNVAMRREDEQRLREEIEGHLALQTADNLRAGMAPDEARRRAVLKFGGIAAVTQDYRAERGLPFIDDTLQDLRYAFRILTKSPGFACAAILTMAVGIGATAAIFSVVDATLLQPLPLPQPQQLVRIEADFPGVGARDVRISQPEWKDLQRSGIFQYVSPVVNGSVNLTGASQPARIVFKGVAPGYLALLGVSPRLGRWFDPRDQTPGYTQEVVISDGLWKRLFGSDPHVVGKSMLLDDDVNRIIGVMPAGFHDPGRTPQQRSTELWAAAGFVAAPSSEVRNLRRLRNFVGRLQPGLTIAAAQSRLDALVESLRKQFPADYPPQSGWALRLVPLQESEVGNARQSLILLLGAVGLVLLIGCANVANLLLARASARGREMAVRQALGAPRLRLVRQLLTESLLLSLLGGASGVAVLFWTKGFLLRMVPESLAGINDISVSWSMLVFAVAASVAAGVIFGLAPALQAGRTDLTDALRQDGRGSRGSTQQTRTRRMLVVTEFALSLVLLIAAGLLLRSFWDLFNVQLGFNPERVFAVQTWLPEPNVRKTDIYGTLIREGEGPLLRELLRRSRTQPGVEQAAIGTSSSIPLSHDRNVTPLIVEGQDLRGTEPPLVERSDVSPEYFPLLEIALRRGRLFDEKDNETVPPVVVINEALARTYWLNGDALGKRVKLRPAQPWSTVVGVIADARTESLADGGIPKIYLSAYQTYASDLVIFLRGTLEPGVAAEQVRQQVQSVNADLPVFGAQTLHDALSDSLSERRLSVEMVAAFAVTALLLAGLGIYGTISYIVSERQREIGIRLALGAQREEIQAMVLRQGLRLAMTGAGVGLVGALIVSNLMQGLLYGVRPTDPLTFVAVTLVLTVVALVACYIPARRATRVDPLVALRYE